MAKPSNTSYCCFISDEEAEGKLPEELLVTHGCSADAEWRIVHGDGPDDYTESCTEHVGFMLTDAPEHRIYPLAGLNTLTP